ncbi:MAG: cysteine synthase A [Lysobacterales bacterium]|jgi:cysteine synthase A
MKLKIVDSVSELIGNTPLMRLSKLTAGKNCAQILAKLEFFNPGGSIKDRPCLEMINKAEEQGLLKKGATIIEPTTGNTGIGLAMLCAERGYQCILTMPEDLSLERIYLLRNYGAEVILTPARKGVNGAIERAKRLVEKTSNSFMPLQFRSKDNPEAHRKTTAVEILEATDGKIDAFVASVGTGGTITGVGEVLKKEIKGVKVVAVEPTKSAVLSGGKVGQHKIQGIGAGFVPEILNQDVIDQIELVDEDEAFQMTKKLGQTMGLCVGISSGANITAALRVAEKLNSNQTVVTILCDTGERYFSTEQYFQA